MRGPIALLMKKTANVNPANEVHTEEYPMRMKKKRRLRLPDIVPSMGEGAEAGCENLQELEER